MTYVRTENSFPNVSGGYKNGWGVTVAVNGQADASRDAVAVGYTVRGGYGPARPTVCPGCATWGAAVTTDAAAVAPVAAFSEGFGRRSS